MTDIDKLCRDIVSMTAPRTTYIASLMSTSDKHAKRMFWLQLMGLVET